MRCLIICFIVLVLLIFVSIVNAQEEKPPLGVLASLVELSKHYNIPIERLVKLQKSGWSELDIRKGLELAKTYHRSLTTGSDIRKKLIEWDSVQRYFDIARQYNVAPEEVVKLRGERCLLAGKI